MSKQTLEIQDFEDKKTKGGKSYTRFKTSDGWMSCFDGKSSTSLKELKGQSVNVEIQESGEFKNIKKFYEVSSGDVPVEVEKPGEQAATPRPRSKGEAFPTSMKVSYAKDCFCAMVTRISQSKFDEMSEEDIKKLMDTSITVIEMAMTKFS